MYGQIYLFFLGERTFCLIVVLGCRFAVLGFMKRPVMADLLTVFVLRFVAIGLCPLWNEFPIA